MPLIPINPAIKKKISPPPIHESIIDGNKATIAFIRYLTELNVSGGSIYDEVNTVIKQVNLDVEEINSLQVELDATQSGAGLSTIGEYMASTISNYINAATSLFNADILIDTAIFDETRDLITTVTTNTALTAKNQVILCNATSGAINITLPDPTLSFGSNRSFEIAVHKIDTTANIITILPFGSELIVGEASQTLELDGEVLNFITNNTNWYLKA